MKFWSFFKSKVASKIMNVFLLILVIVVAITITLSFIFAIRAGLWKFYIFLGAIWIIYFIIKALLHIWGIFIDKVTGAEPIDEVTYIKELLKEREQMENQEEHNE